MFSWIGFLTTSFKKKLKKRLIKRRRFLYNLLISKQRVDMKVEGSGMCETPAGVCVDGEPASA